jgi:DNA-binding NarL/FixJ family response regulator
MAITGRKANQPEQLRPGAHRLAAGRETIMNQPYRIILADDHVPFRGEIKKILKEIPGVEVVAEVGEGNELFGLLESLRPDLIILDISMPNLRAMKATQMIKSRHPDIKVIIMVMDWGIEYLDHAVSVGADGILLKQCIAEDLELVIQRLRRGEQYFPGFLEENKTAGELLGSPIS